MSNHTVELGGKPRRLVLNENAIIALYELTGDDFLTLGQRLSDQRAPLAEKLRTMRLLTWTCLCQSQGWDDKKTLQQVGEWLESSAKRTEVMTAVGKVIEEYLAKIAGPPEFKGQLAPFVPTPQEVAEVMASFVKPGDVVVDLGAGNGILLDEADERGAHRLIGYEREINRFDKLKNKYTGDAFCSFELHDTDIREADVSQADVVFVYLLGASNAELKAKLLREMKKGSWLVSHDFPMPDWPADTTIPVECPDRVHTVYAWQIP